jgi:translation initiation factor 2D
VVMDINWDHPEAKTFKPYKLPEAPKEDKKGPDAASVARNEGLIKVVELYRPNGKAINIFSAVGAG